MTKKQIINSHRVKKMKIFFIFIILINLFLPVNVAYSISETLIKSSADIQYKHLVYCIKNNNNDISKCIGEFSNYLKNEKKLLSIYTDNQKYQERLINMIDYLRKSTDIFINKARKTHDVKDWKKSVSCATLLSRLSDKYSRYRDVEKEYLRAQKGNSASKSLAALLEKLKQTDMPDKKYVGILTKFVDATAKRYDIFPLSFQKDSTDYAQSQVNGYLEALKNYNDALSNDKKQSFENANDWQATYDLVIKIPGVNPKSAAMQKQAETLCSQLSNYEKRWRDVFKASSDGYELYSNNNMTALSQHVAITKQRFDIIYNVLSQTENMNKICSNQPKINKDKLQFVRDAIQFQSESAAGYKDEQSGNFAAASLRYHNALQLSLVPAKIREKALQINRKILDNLFNSVQQNVNAAINHKKELTELLMTIDGVAGTMKHDPGFIVRLHKLERDIINRWATEIREGTRKVQTIYDAYVAFTPIFDKTYLMNPPVDGPKEKNKYYAWPCKIREKYGSGYICLDMSWVLQVEGGEIELFVIKNVKEKFSELLTGSQVAVFGKYIRNKPVTTLLGDTRPVPVLEDCYIFPLGFRAYPIEKIDTLLGITE